MQTYYYHNRMIESEIYFKFITFFRLIFIFGAIINSPIIFADSLGQCLKDESKCYGGLTRTTVGDPKIGDIYKNIIPISNKVQIFLPDGLWQVVETTSYKGETSWHAPWYVISLLNLDKNSPFKFVFYDYFKNSSTWQGWELPCEKPQKFPGINIIENKKNGLTFRCSYVSYWNNPKLSLNFLKTHTYWKNEIKNYDDKFINSLPSSALVFESSIQRVNSSHIREVFLLDPKSLNINGFQFSRSNFLSKSLVEISMDKNEEKLYNWFINYSENRVKTFFDQSNSDIQLAKFPFPRLVENEIEIKETASKDEALKNQLSNQVESQDVAVKEPSTSDALAKEIALGEAAAKEAAAKEMAIKEAAAKEAAAKEMAIKEAAAKEAAAKELALKEASAKEAAAKELALKEASAKEAATKEKALKEASAKEAAAKEMAIKEAAAKEAAAKEMAIKEAAAKEAAAKELALKEAVAKELANNNKKALVIGNDNYDNVARLKNARSDANAMGLALQSVGYKVQVKTDLNHKEMKKVLRQFKMGVEPGDEIVIFFAGHGLQIAGSNYLLPTDISAESEEQIKDDAIQLQRLLDDMNDQKVRLTLALIDACRDNPFPKSGRALGGRGLAPTSAATGQMIIFSAGVGQQALDRLGSSDNDPNSVFTRIFIKEIKKPGVRIDNVVREVRKKVVEAAKTVGHDQVPAIYDQVVGDFYFVK
jgi:hypothetical protein